MTSELKKGSAESQAVRKFGEKRTFVKGQIDPQTGQVSKDWVEKPYTLEDLKTEFPNKWENIVKADTWFRAEYNQFIDQINAMKSEIYPNADENYQAYDKRIARVVEGTGVYENYSETERSDKVNQLRLEQEQYIRGKRIPKRNDYYRHFTELNEGFKALKNIVDTPAQIGSNLQGISQHTKPKSKWESFAQKRKGEYTEADAISGYLDYLDGASYAIYIDPHIAKFRNLATILADATYDTNNAGNPHKNIEGIYR